MTKLNPHTTHRYHLDPNCLCFHIKAKLEEGDFIGTEGKTEKIKKVVRNQPSSIYRGTTYYEVEVYGNPVKESSFFDTRKKH